ncbi:putative uncharacterized protein [Prevotella sp. CAG:924]|nr:putative uncharacterized protein [Prevotella sp. CAG:924]
MTKLSGAKLLKNQNIILGFCVLVLVVLCWLSVERPMRFEREQAEREKAVKARLLHIRTAEERYRARKGVYTGDWATLIRAKLLADSLQYVPFSGKERFHLEASFVMGKSGRQVPVMQCGATYDQYLKGLDENAVANLTEKANMGGRFPGLMIGDITQPNENAGNWE